MNFCTVCQFWQFLFEELRLRASFYNFTFRRNPSHKIFVVEVKYVFAYQYAKVTYESYTQLLWIISITWQKSKIWLNLLEIIRHDLRIENHRRKCVTGHYYVLSIFFFVVQNFKSQLPTQITSVYEFQLGFFFTKSEIILRILVHYLSSGFDWDKIGRILCRWHSR